MTPTIRHPAGPGAQPSRYPPGPALEILRVALGAALLWALLSPWVLYDYRLLWLQAALAAAFAIQLAALLWVRIGAAAPLPAQPRPRADAAASGIAGILVILAGGLVIVAWHRVFAAQMGEIPIDARYADMLPLLLAGFTDLDAGQTPYRPHFVGWELRNYFLPATFAPYYLAYKLGGDIRWVTVLCLDLTLLTLGWAAWSRFRGAPLAGFIVWLAVGGLLCAHIHQQGFVRIVQLGPYWLYVALGFAALAQDRLRLAALAFGLCLAARETAVFLVVPVLLGLWRFRRRELLRLAPWVVVGLALMFLPFFLADPGFYRGNLDQYTSLEAYLDAHVYRFLGFSGLLSLAGVGHLRWAGFLVLFGSVLLLWLRRAQGCGFGSLAAAAGAASLTFAAWAPITWEYLFVDALIVLAVWTTDRVALATAGGRATARG